MFKLDGSGDEFDDNMFDLKPTSLSKGIISFGVNVSRPTSPKIRRINENESDQSTHLARYVNLNDCLENDSISFSPSTSTQINKNIVSHKTGPLFNVTNTLSPIKMKPGIMCDLKNNELGSCVDRMERSNRKFPGPAGSLPRLARHQNYNDVSFSTFKSDGSRAKGLGERSRNEETVVPETVMYNSQFRDSDIWNSARAKIGPQCWRLFEKYCLANVFHMMKNPENLPNSKIPVICLKIQEIDFLLADASSTMIDPTASIKCAIHRHVLHKFKDTIKIGSVFVLKNVSIFSPTGKKFYLNITENNIVEVISESSSVYQSQQTLISLDQIGQIEIECLRPPPTISQIIGSNEPLTNQIWASFSASKQSCPSHTSQTSVNHNQTFIPPINQNSLIPRPVNQNSQNNNCSSTSHQQPYLNSDLDNCQTNQNPVINNHIPPEFMDSEMDNFFASFSEEDFDV